MSDPRLDRTFAALADPTRRAILLRLSEGEAAAGELAEPFAISAPAVSRHLRVLEEAGLIVRRVDGQHRRMRLDPAALRSASAWLDFYRKFWSESLDQLDEHLKSLASPKPTSERKTRVRTRKQHRRSK
ncbi:MAG: metalloregulator ArsR/SmtB family transcription factor [Planctomycetes bacterium]|nr:metalloregulator ArsR/SmtB family transcription factor [Planctomycetota bacterium]